MAIKFEDKRDGAKPGRAIPKDKAEAEPQAAPPAAGQEPHNAEGGSELPFGKPLRSEKKGRRK